jgi:hypothetical protein
MDVSFLNKLWWLEVETLEGLFQGSCFILVLLKYQVLLQEKSV